MYHVALSPPGVVRAKGHLATQHGPAAQANRKRPDISIPEFLSVPRWRGVPYVPEGPWGVGSAAGGPQAFICGAFGIGTDWPACGVH